MSLLDDKEIPVGFGMALAQDLNAMNAFSSMGEEEKQQVLERTRQVSSKEEMQQLVSSLTSIG